ncbi:MAG TPA: SDR family NAD(P)-dependent oxidoreductase, partial [Burkholderiaceae bacterium]|nr:SDR family NAD(P)-dependent oxidoreductase [Burkholderiaceae bacterium]
MDIKNKVAIVTGGASGLGEGTLRRLVGGGARVAIFDMNEQLGQALAAEFPDQVIFCRVDVTDEASAQAGIAATLAAFGSIQICVNCAGIPGALGRIVSKKGPYPLAEFAKVVSI